MKRKLFQTLCIALIFISFTTCVGPDCDNHFYIQGVEEDVEVIVDYWGVPHIYAQNQKDLFFAQGFVAARDRLFQFEIWRRQATGTVSEILGERELKRDIGTRLFKFRGDMNAEMDHYHKDGREIINSFVAGVNAYINQVKENPDLLPLEFQILGIEPDYWTPEVVISRHQGLLGNIGQELNLGRAVDKGGVAKVLELSNFKPANPDISIDPKINSSLLHDDILELYNAYRRPVRFTTDDKNPDFNLAQADQLLIDPESIGSNNWILSGRYSDSGSPVMANDPHRTVAVPSLRYLVHLNAPGWDVIGGGEPEIPGVSIGHNGYGAWGLTVFQTDGEDLYVYQTNPENSNQYLYQGEWVDMQIVTEEINVKGQQPISVDLKYTRHGPVVYEDREHNVAYAVRCAWMEPGGSPYLASLRIDQAQSWEEFREACNAFHIPGENMIWADKDGNIGWQAVGIAPIRRNWSGLVPVPGDGSYEWDGYLEIRKKPNLVNPSAGFFSTANNYLTPDDYPYPEAVGYSWSDDYRNDRIKSWIGDVIERDTVMPFEDHKKLQTSYTSQVSGELLRLLDNVQFEGKYDSMRIKTKRYYFMDLSSSWEEAGLYVTWERIIQDSIRDMAVPEALKPYIRNVPMEKIVKWLKEPGTIFGRSPQKNRDDFVKATFYLAVDAMEEKFGPDLANWGYSEVDFKHVEIKHALDPILDDSLKGLFNMPKMPRGGNSYTVNNTAGGDLQTHGATFRVIIDTGDFSRSVFSNSPGQSGNPTDKHYQDLYVGWTRNQYRPLYYVKDSVVSHRDYYLRIFKKE